MFELQLLSSIVTNLERILNSGPGIELERIESFDILVELSKWICNWLTIHVFPVTCSCKCIIPVKKKKHKIELNAHSCPIFVSSQNRQQRNSTHRKDKKWNQYSKKRKATRESMGVHNTLLPLLLAISQPSSACWIFCKKERSQEVPKLKWGKPEKVKKKAQLRSTSTRGPGAWPMTTLIVAVPAKT